MNKKLFALVGMLIPFSVQVSAKGGGGRPRPETISCFMTFDGATTQEAAQSVLVQNAQALLKGEARGVSYVFSIRGKTAVARLTDSSQVVTAQGAIEMLRGGGQAKATTPNAVIMKKGEDDANDGTPEREAGFQLSIASPQSPNLPKVSLKCESVNQTEKENGEVL